MEKILKHEVEGFGVTYDRYVMSRHQQILTRDLNLNKILEAPTHGAKAASSIYSLGFAQAGCEVNLINPDDKMIGVWKRLGLDKNLKLHRDIDVYNLPFEDNSFDLVWNFVTFTELKDIPAFLKEMKRVTGKYIYLISCNNFQLGYPLHRCIHKIFGFPWNHGNTYFNFIGNVKKELRKTGLRISESGAIDTPPWPDPVGPRDIRLHKNFGKDKQYIPEWEVPIEKYMKTGFPLWIKTLGAYDITLRKGYLKLPFSHLFYVLAEK
ncbi:MAG TPA: class I SAM-dependent methyltransferase [Nitrospirae bacterium]|nr:class I SAM-dependent methyltransferase [Nitrospirota bacterium]HDH11966.1 class I SAM-dependent methyltransferase [Nitrospirota bacterium]HDY99872.1 class I SAM-dependent methyltransferase [Nitrospirota bacterium]